VDVIHRSRWLYCLGVVTLASAGCSSSSGGSVPPVDGGGPVDDGGSTDDATGVQEAAAAATCDAASLATLADGGAPACFACQATKCASMVAACSTDCVCTAQYTCLQQNSMGGLNSGYSACPDAINAQMNGNKALTDVADCAALKCMPECFGGTGDGG
jgi:hypothetical protein